MKIPKPGLLVKILIAIALGVAVGYIMPSVLPMWIGRVFLTFNAIFSQLLGFMIPLIIVGFVAPAIADIGGKAGKMLLATAVLAYLATISAGFISYFTGEALFPSLIDPRSLDSTSTGNGGIEPYFTVEMPPLMSVMTALVTAFIIGLGIAYCQGKVLRDAFSELRDIVSLVIKSVIIPLLPLYIFGIFLNMTVAGEVGPIVTTFIKVIGVIFALHIGILILQYCVAALFVHRNPFKLLVKMLPAYFTALGTQSSAATIPVTLRQVISLGVNEDIAGFTVPLCATIHMSGSTLKIVACALALMIMQGLPYSTPMFAGFICMLAITIIAAPGVPGGAIMASLGLLSSMLGFSEADQALMIALYIAMDSFGTACNVTGDGFIALIINRFFAPRKAGQ